VLGEHDGIIDVFSLEDLKNASDATQMQGTANGRLHRILIVGGAGYLGSVLTLKLLDRGYTVRILDNFLYGKRSLEQIPQIPDAGGHRG